MNKRFLDKTPFWSWLLIGFIATFASSNINWGGDHWRGILEADAKGYYGHLPAIFIYDDLSFAFFDELEGKKYYNKNWHYDYRVASNGHTVNRYFFGTALAEAPFFLIAHGLSYLFDQPPDGYSLFYPILINIAAICYLLLGLWILNLVLKRFHISPVLRGLTLLAITFGTNLFYYTIGEPGMSHIYSFAFVSLFIWQGFRFFDNYKWKHLWHMAWLLGFIILIRPVNGLVLLSIPFLAYTAPSFVSGLLNVIRKPHLLMGAILLGLGVVCIQLVIYKIQTDHFLVYSYNEYKLNFAQPHIWQILFSYKKGLFVYTPLFMVALAGFYYLFKQAAFAGFMLFLFLFAVTYVLSSWPIWWYGGSFSSRVYVEYLPYFTLLLALAMQHMRPLLVKRIYIGIIVLLTLVCQIQTYQYRYFQIHWADMTKEKYWEVFLRIDRLIQ